MNDLLEPPAVVRPAEDVRRLVEDTRRAIEEGDRCSWRVADNFRRLGEAGWTQQAIADEFGVSQPTVSKSVACSRNYSLANNRPRFWDAWQEVDGKRPHVAHNSGRQEWYTPPEHVDAARQALGGIDLDPASSDKAQETVQASTYFTKDDDGLSKPWAGRVWMNPPYASGLVEQFAEKLVTHYEAGDVTSAVVLVNNATDAGWFRQLSDRARALCLPTGRVRFLEPEGEKGAPLQGQAVLYLGDDVDAFRAAFEQFGPVWAPLR